MERQLCLDGRAGKGPQHSGLVWLPVLCCFTSTETLRTVRDRKPRMVTTTFTQLLNSEAFSSALLYVHRDRRDYQGRGALDGHLDFHTAPEL